MTVEENIQAQCRAVLAGYTLPPLRAVEARESGMNNTTRYAVLEDGSLRVVRIYENHTDEAKLRTEHELLLKLSRERLPFAVPCPVAADNGATWVTTPSGKPAALFHYLEGERPGQQDRSLAGEYGRTVGRLVQTLAKVELAEPPAYPAYDELLDITEEDLRTVADSFRRSPALAAAAEDAAELLDQVTALKKSAGELHRLPRQLIHGDVSFANLLTQDGRVSAVLDFEFATRDIRAMELAVCLAEQLSVPGGLDGELIREMIAGYEAILPLEAEERRLLPHLVKLRKLDVFLHFWHRREAGLDPDEVLLDQTKRSVRVCRFVDQALR